MSADSFSCKQCGKPFSSGVLMPGTAEWLCVACVQTGGLLFANPTSKPQYLKLPVPIGGIEFGYAQSAEEADANSLRCCHGIGQAPRCRMKATHIPIYADGQLAGDAYCQDHIPVKKKGSLYVPLRCVVVER